MSLYSQIKSPKTLFPQSKPENHKFFNSFVYLFGVGVGVGFIIHSILRTYSPMLTFQSGYNFLSYYELKAAPILE